MSWRRQRSERLVTAAAAALTHAAAAAAGLGTYTPVELQQSWNHSQQDELHACVVTW
jgi:hypothetical protein